MKKLSFRAIGHKFSKIENEEGMGQDKEGLVKEANDMRLVRFKKS